MSVPVEQASFSGNDSRSDGDLSDYYMACSSRHKATMPSLVTFYCSAAVSAGMTDLVMLS